MVTKAVTTGRTGSALMVKGGAVVVGSADRSACWLASRAVSKPRPSGTIAAAAAITPISAIRIRRLRCLAVGLLMMGDKVPPGSGSCGSRCRH